MTARHYRIDKDARSWGEREVFREEHLADGSTVRIMNPTVYQRALRAARHALRQAEPFRPIETDGGTEAPQPVQIVEPLRMASREPPQTQDSREAAEPSRTAEPVESTEPLPTAEPASAAEPAPAAESPHALEDLEPQPAEHREESNLGGQSESRL